MTNLEAVEDRLQRVLDPYRERLEAFELYGRPFLRRPGAKAHDWFAGVSPGNGLVRFFLLPIHHHPELLDGISPALRKRKRGASLFGFSTISDDEIAELEELVRRAFVVTDERDDA